MFTYCAPITPATNNDDGTSEKPKTSPPKVILDESKISISKLAPEKSKAALISPCDSNQCTSYFTSKTGDIFYVTEELDPESPSQIYLSISFEDQYALDSVGGQNLIKTKKLEFIEGICAEVERTGEIDSTADQAIYNYARDLSLSVINTQEKTIINDKPLRNNKSESTFLVNSVTRSNSHFFDKIILTGEDGVLELTRDQEIRGDIDFSMPKLIELYRHMVKVKHKLKQEKAQEESDTPPTPEEQERNICNTLWLDEHPQI